MTPMQQMFLGVGGKKKTYIDEIFSNYVWTGSGSHPRSINNSIDFDKGGMVWMKARTEISNHYLFDTERYVSTTNSPAVKSNSDAAEGNNYDGLDQFNNNGFRTNGALMNTSNEDYISWSFRKAPGFFDVVKFTAGSSANQRVSHSLGCIPGCILLKDTDSATSWLVYHCKNSSSPRDTAVYLNSSGSRVTSSNIWGTADATSTDFGIKASEWLTAGNEIIAYLFAGGEDATTATARSVSFNNNGSISTAAFSDDFKLGTDNFTVECWIKPTDFSTDQYFIGNRASVSSSSAEQGFDLYLDSTDETVKVIKGTDASPTQLFSDVSIKIPAGAWTHVALVRKASTDIRLYINGTQSGSTHTTSLNHQCPELRIGQKSNGGNSFNGNISNLRITKGQALYTSSFKPTSVPFTTTSQGATSSNVVFLACNNSSVTGSTVSPVTLNSYNATASTDSPFDDPAGFVFGDSGDQNVVKTGVFVGNNDADGPEVYLGWEPSFILLKPAESSENWGMWDSMRGIVTGGNDMRLLPNGTNEEITNFDGISLTPTGFKITSSNSLINPDNEDVIFVAVRREDPLVATPASAGSEVFTMANGAASDIPAFTSGFPVDFAFARVPTGTENWHTTTRLRGSKALATNSDAAATTDTGLGAFDFNNGYCSTALGTTSYQGWMWKRSPGFTTVAYEGKSLARQIPHDLNAIPEMMWFKNMTGLGGQEWRVFHKGLNGGTNPETYLINLNDNSAESSNGASFWNGAPTATHFGLQSNGSVNFDSEDFIAMLFASVSGISKVGYYDGSSSTITITTGFTPRFLIIKRTTGSGNWYVLDTTRGWGAGNDNYLSLNLTVAQVGYDFGAPTSSGFTLTSGDDTINNTGEKYIYYAHA